MRERPELGVSNASTPKAVVDAAIPNAAISEAATCADALPSAAISVPEPALSDAAIVGRVRAGDTALFELLMRRYNRLLFRLARGIVRDDDEARDVVQAAYVRASYHLEQFRGPDGFKGWIARIAVNEALGRVRRAPSIVDAEQHALALTELADAEPENAASSRDLSRILQAAIDRLPDKLRIVLVLSAIEGHDTREVSALLTIPEGTVRSRLFLARKALAERLQWLTTHG